jgi:hypothetical protein
MIKQIYRFVFLIFITSGPLLADEVDNDIDDDGGENCINVRTLRHTDVVDDQHILFFMTGKTIFLNTLPKPCRGLSRERRFSYSTTSRMLCEFDTIRILSDMGGTIHEGRACRLGAFYLTSKENVEAARERGAEPPAAKPLPGADEEDPSGKLEESASPP